MKLDNNSLIHLGHRQRMKDKLSNHGARIFDTYELLEMLLYNVIPYKDTNPIAKRHTRATYRKYDKGDQTYPFTLYDSARKLV